MASYSLTTGDDTIVMPPSGGTVYATAATLNAGDSLTGGAGTDVLELVGAGTFNLAQLASFTGFWSVKLENATNSGASLTLGSQSIAVDATGYLNIQVNSLSNWNGSDVINGDASTSFPTTSLFFTNSSYPPQPLTYDLTANTFSHVGGVNVGADNVTLLINSADTAGIQSFAAAGLHDQLVTAGSTLDLSHTTVSGFTVASTNGVGTTFTVGDLGTAFQIAGGPGNDTLVAQGFTFTADQRTAIFNTSSIETIVDQSGTYAKPAGANHPPAVTAQNTTATHGQTSAAATNLFTASDPDGDTITTYAFYDATGNGHWAVNGVAQAAATEIDVPAANLSQVSYVFGPTGSTPDTLYIRANDGTLWSTWQGFTATPGLDHAPVVTAPNVAATHGETSIAASSLFTTTDADNDTITQYAFYDATGNGHWVVNGVVQAANTEIDVNAANLSQVSYVFGPTGSAPDTLYIRANDGFEWGAWQGFTATPGPDHAPVVTASNLAAAHNQSLAASGMFSVTDADSDSMTKYEFYDATGNGHFVLNGVTQATATIIDITAAQLANMSYQSGSGTDQLYVRAFDGDLWSAWTPFTAAAPIDQAPVVTAPNAGIAARSSVAASSLFTVSDPEGDSIISYDFYDATGSGHFVVNGLVQAAGTIIPVTAAQLASTSYVAGSTNDQLYVRASDGTMWSAWTPFTAGAAPTVTASNIALAAGASATASSLFTATDGGTFTQYDFYDATGNGHFTVNGTTQATASIIPVPAAQLAQTSYVAGTGTDQLYVRAYDGTSWSAWTPFTAGPTAPTVSAANVSLAASSSVAASNLFTATDTDGGSITAYDFYDATGSGHFVVNGTSEQAGTIIPVSAAQLAQTSYVAGAGTDQLYVRAFEGALWSNWMPFTAGATPPSVTAPNLSTVPGQTIAAANLFGVTDGGTITDFNFYDATGKGHFTINGTTQATASIIDVSAAQLAQTGYVSGNGTDQLYVRASDGTNWSAWTPFTVASSSPAIVNAGATLELGTASSAAVTFFAGTGTLKLDNSSSFAGTVAGMTGNDSIDFADINFATIQTPSFSPTSSGGTLSVTDGTHIAKIALLLNYMASSFVTSSDGHGGTSIQVQPEQPVVMLTQPQHA
jgi:hypothetical protein